MDRQRRDGTYDGWHGQGVPSVQHGPAPAASTGHARMASRGPSGAVRERRGGCPGSERALSGIGDRRRSRPCGLPPGDDGEALGLRLLHRRDVIAPDRTRDVRRRRVPSSGRRPASGPRLHRGVSSAASSAARRAFLAGPSTLPQGRPGQTRSRRHRWDEGRGQRQQAQGHELRPHGRGRKEARRTSPRTARRGRAGRCRRGCEVRQRQARRRTPHRARSTREPAQEASGSERSAGGGGPCGSRAEGRRGENSSSR